MMFGSGGAGLTNNGPANTLFFSAGGVFGTLTAIPEKAKTEDDD